MDRSDVHVLMQRRVERRSAVRDAAWQWAMRGVDPRRARYKRAHVDTDDDTP